MEVKLIEIPPEESSTKEAQAAPVKKKALSAFNLFLKKHKETIGKATLAEMSQKWGQMSEEEKDPYRKEAEAEKQKVAEMQMEEGDKAGKSEEKKSRTFAVNRIKQKVKLVATDKKIRKDAILTLRNALELFLTELGQSVEKVLVAQKRKTLQLKDLIAVLKSNERYHFAACIFLRIRFRQQNI
eukprot:TRINITY_DN1504_c0_g1_i2.p3 TRINITY_DN1504_c0_g1~~TRINITY_DN1504_c0_g1_i2.p3  ORF type:complete len:184 (+),score=41.58 TRINITY_DN1504_c0_g1_i2:1450-2001(+)